MHKTQVVSNETNTHQVTICLLQWCLALCPQITSIANWAVSYRAANLSAHHPHIKQCNAVLLLSMSHTEEERDGSEYITDKDIHHYSAKGVEPKAPVLQGNITNQECSGCPWKVDDSSNHILSDQPLHFCFISCITVHRATQKQAWQAVIYKLSLKMTANHKTNCDGSGERWQTLRALWDGAAQLQSVGCSSSNCWWSPWNHF